MPELQRIADNTTDWVFDPETDTYLVDGKRRTSGWVRRQVEAIVEASQKDMQDITRRMREGSMSVADWYATMQDNVTVLHQLGSLAALGDKRELIEQADADLEAAIQTELGYLRVFHSHVAQAHEQAANAVGPMAAATALAVAGARWVQRAGAYAGAGLITYERQRWYLMLRYGYQEGRRVLSDAEHCDGCIVEAGKGWVPTGQLRPLGYEQCGQWCKCIVEYRRLSVLDLWGRINPDIRSTEWMLPR